ncbi:MAG: polysaccharide deacetylase family protein [Patescibacteria group bacterium]
MKRFFKSGIAALIWASGIGPLIRFLAEPRLVAIAYHRVSDRTHQLAIHPRAFATHIAYLKKRGYQFVLIRDIAAADRGKKAAVYFDDGFREVPSIDIPATLFLTIDYLDQKNGNGYLTWQEAMRLKNRGEIGSHSVTHRKLTKMPLVEARQEMARSKQLLEERLGVEVTSFSYPKGRSSQELETLAHDVGYTITTADTRVRKVRPDPGESLAVFKLKLLGIL